MKIAKEIKKDFRSYEFPVSESEIGCMVERLPVKYLEGLTEIVISHPLTNRDTKYFARYEPRKRKIYLFVHKKENGKFVIDLGFQTLKYNPNVFRKKALKAVLHEIGHHVGIKEFENESDSFADRFARHFYYVLDD